MLKEAVGCRQGGCVNQGEVVTLFFSDIERSTELLVQLGDRYAELLADHDRIVSHEVAAHGGTEIDRQGDSVLALFDDSSAGLAAAIAVQAALGAHAWPDHADVRVRIGLHVGPVTSSTSGLIGLAVHVAARVCDAAHGGQILVTDAVAAAVEQGAASLEDLGSFRLRYVPEPHRLLSVRSSPNALAPPRHVVPWQRRDLQSGFTEADASQLIAEVESLMLSFYGPDSPRVVESLDARWASIEATLSALRDRGETAAFARLAGSLSPYLVAAKGRTVLARELLGVALADRQDDPSAELLFEIGRALSDTGDPYRAAAVFEEMLAAAEEANDPLQMAHSLAAIGQLQFQWGDLDAAEHMGREARTLELDRRLVVTSYGSHLLGLVALSRGQVDEARRFFLEALATSRAVGNDVLAAGDLCNLCETALVAGDDEAASGYLHEIEEMLPQLPQEYARYQTLGSEGILALRRGDVNAAQRAFDEYRKLTRRTQNRAEYAISLEGLAAVAVMRGDTAQAARQFGEAAATRKMVGSSRFILEDNVFSPFEAAARDALSPPEFSKVWRQGARNAIVESTATSSHPQDVTAKSTGTP
jgi:class 3 adenylate cyclase/tetratricopeptide (TPR) repeat protein